MTSSDTSHAVFRRPRTAGSLVVAVLAFALALCLLVALPFQTTWVAKSKLFAQPAFWPAIAVFGMVLFTGLHLVSLLRTDRVPGRKAEVMVWLRSLEYVGWFLTYVALVPWAGYLPATLAFTLLLTYRLGYRSARWMLAAAGLAIAVVLLFKGALSVNIPAGALYDLLPPGGLRTFVMTHF